MIGFLAKRPLDGKVVALLRVHDGVRAEQWTPGGWFPVGLEWSGIGGATEYDPGIPEEVVDILRDFGASNLDPVR